MKAHSAKRVLTFGEFVMAAYNTWDKRRARGIVWLILKARLVEFHGLERIVISARNPK